MASKHSADDHDGRDKRPSSSVLDQEAECFRILTASHHFEVMHLPEKLTAVDEIRRQYRRLALRVHPDKNSSPDAEQAFKILSTAYDCLSEETLQKTYLHKLQSTKEHRSSFHDHGAAKRPWESKKARDSKDDDLHMFTPVNQKWWEKKSWDEVEDLLKKQEAMFEHSIRQEKEHYKEKKLRKSEALQAQGAQVRKLLTPLRNKYRLDEPQNPTTHSTEASVCYLCKRQFRDKKHLDEHRRWSKLHRENLLKYS